MPKSSPTELPLTLDQRLTNPMLAYQTLRASSSHPSKLCCDAPQSRKSACEVIEKKSCPSDGSQVRVRYEPRFPPEINVSAMTGTRLDS